jgi:hypothetical protein
VRKTHFILDESMIDGAKDDRQNVAGGRRIRHRFNRVCDDCPTSGRSLCGRVQCMLAVIMRGRHLGRVCNNTQSLWQGRSRNDASGADLHSSSRKSQKFHWAARHFLPDQRVSLLTAARMKIVNTSPENLTRSKYRSIFSLCCSVACTTSHFLPRCLNILGRKSPAFLETT